MLGASHLDAQCGDFVPQPGAAARHISVMKLYSLAQLLACGPAAHAAVLRGVAVDGQSGKPLARTRVQLVSIERSTEKHEAARTSPSGVFSFPALKAGLYLLSATRDGFAAMEYGQPRWNAPGRPLKLEAASELLVELRMSRLGAISGFVTDENDVGLPEQQVLVFRISPPGLAAKGITDDRGAYRIGEIQPGRYVVRNAPKALDETGGTVPTYYKNGSDLTRAERVPVRIDAETPDVNLRPAMGRLLHLGVNMRNIPVVSVTLSSELGPIPVSLDGSRYVAKDLAPGVYELLVEGYDATYARARAVAGYLKLRLDRNEPDLRIPLSPLPAIEAHVQGPDGRETDAAEVLIRRRDLAGPGAAQRLGSRSISLLPGEWEVMVNAPAGTYATSLDVWNSLTLLPAASHVVSVRLSSAPASLRGTVTDSKKAQVAGAPVYLERYDAQEQRRLGELRSTRTGSHGEYRFDSVAPGTWRVLSSLDLLDPDEEAMALGKPKLIALKERDAAGLDLEVTSLLEPR